MEREVSDIPWCSSNGSQDFGLQPLYDLSMGQLSAVPELNAICPYWFENAFIWEERVGEGELWFTPQKPIHAAQFKVQVKAF
jgi:hypothetical protein